MLEQRHSVLRLFRAVSSHGLGLHAVALLLAACIGALGPLSASASATLTREPEPFSPLTGAGSAITLVEPSGIGLDEVSGNVFVTGAEGNAAVGLLGAEGGAPAEVLPPFSIGGFSFGAANATGLAYDNSASSPAKGTLYVYDPGVSTIKKFTRSLVTERYEATGEIAVAGAGETVGMGLDAAGNVYLGSFTAKSVYKFSPAGTLLHKWTSPSELPQALNRPGQIAVDAAGDLFIQRQGAGAFKCPVGAGETIVPASCVEIVSSGVTGIAVDRLRNRLYVALGKRIAEYDPSSLELLGEFGKEGPAGEEPILRSTEQIAVNEATGRIYISDRNQGDVAVFGPLVAVPTVRATATSEVTGTKVTLNGSVNPEGSEVSECFFEYGETTSYGKTGSCEGGTLPIDEEDHPVSAKISGLLPNGHTYHYRLRARNEHGTAKSTDKTLVTADTVASEAATSIASTTATLHGTVRPEGRQYSSCSFEWGLTRAAGFEKTTACEPSAAEIEADFTTHQVSLPLSGLEPNATYKFRLSATNSDGTLRGQILTFVTTGPPQIIEIRASGATQSTAKLEAKINPSGFATAYRFEWGPTAAYQHRIPAEFNNTEKLVRKNTKRILIWE